MNVKRISAVLMALLLLVCFAVSASAQNAYVYDTSSLLTDSQVAKLEEKAANYSSNHQFGMYIVTVESFRSSGYSELRDYGERLYKENDLGLGANNAGAMLILSTSDRDYSFVFPTSEYKYVFTEYGLNRIEETIVSYLRSDDYYGAFNAFLTMCDDYMTASENGAPIDEEEEGLGIFSVVPGAIAAVLAGLGLSAPMKSAGLKHDADQYVVRGSLNLRRRSDMFLHRSVTRTPRQTQSSSSHSSTHHSSGGFSSRSGKY